MNTPEKVLNPAWENAEYFQEFNSLEQLVESVRGWLGYNYVQPINRELPCEPKYLEGAD